MNEPANDNKVPPNPPELRQDKFVKRIAGKAARKLKARNKGSPRVWSGLGMMGLIGWAVVVPTLAGAALGHWLDQQYPGGHSWTLALLMAGLTIGCFNAWHWVDKEDKAMHEEDDSDS